MPSYRITEPHPSVPTSTIYYGRGGAGNVTRVNPKEVTDGATASGPASRIKLPSPPSNGYFTSGRGGAGNVHREKERAIFSFDEELAQQERLREHSAPVYHIGRGGAGNLVSSGEAVMPKAHRMNSAASTSSSSSENSVRRSFDGAFHRISKHFSRQS